MSDKDPFSFEMKWRVNIRFNTCRVFAYKAGDVAIYSQDYKFRIYPWTNINQKIATLKIKMIKECEIVLRESNTK